MHRSRAVACSFSRSSGLLMHIQIDGTWEGKHPRERPCSMPTEKRQTGLQSFEELACECPERACRQKSRSLDEVIASYCNALRTWVWDVAESLGLRSFSSSSDVPVHQGQSNLSSSESRVISGLKGISWQNVFIQCLQSKMLENSSGYLSWLSISFSCGVRRMCMNHTRCYLFTFSTRSLARSLKNVRFFLPA